MKKYLFLAITILVVISNSLVFAETTPLEKAKILFSDASIQLEIAQLKYNEAKQKLIAEMQKPPIAEPKEEK